MSKKNTLKPLAGMLGTAFVASLAFSPITNAESNPFTLNELSDGYMLAEHGEGKCGEGMKKAEGKCGEGMKKAAGKCGEGKCGKGVDMKGNVVELGTFRYGGDNMAKYADGKMGTGTKDPGVCGTFSAAKCSVGHIK